MKDIEYVQTCYCCFRHGIYQYKETEDGPECEIGEDRGTIDNPEIDHIMLFKDDHLEIQAFHLEYVHEHLIPSNWEKYYELEVDYNLLPLHTPLYKYILPVKFATFPEDNSNETKAMRFIKGGIYGSVCGYLNCFRANKQMPVESLLKLILLRKNALQKRVNKWQKFAFDIAIQQNYDSNQ